MDLQENILGHVAGVMMVPHESEGYAVYESFILGK
jgi:hypothetical protein